MEIMKWEHGELTERVPSKFVVLRWPERRFSVSPASPFLPSLAAVVGEKPAQTFARLLALE